VLTLLERAIERGEYVSEIISQEEINGYLAQVVDQSQEETSDRPMRLSQLQIQIDRDTVTVWVIGNRKPMHLSYTFIGTPAIDEDGYHLIVDRVLLGHLPLPPPLKQVVIKRMAEVFNKMEREWYVLNNLSEIKLDLGQVRLVTKR